MGHLKSFVLGIFVSITIAACANIKFFYKYYVYNYEEQILQGPKPIDDLPASVCSYTNDEYQCVVMKVDEFFRLKSDYEKKVLRIQELERNCGRNN